jgi:copper(I)-binding protein
MSSNIPSTRPCKEIDLAGQESEVATRSLDLLARQKKSQREELMKQFIRALCGMLVAGVLINGPARADEIVAGDLVITPGWIGVTPGGARVGGAYLTIQNKGAAPVRLTGASADFADKVQLREKPMNGDATSMRPVENGVVIEPGKTLRLAPDDLHLMLLGLRRPLRQGEKVAIALEFEKGEQVGVPLDVGGVGAQEPSNPDGGRF